MVGSFGWLAWESAHRINREDEANRVVLLLLLLVVDGGGGGGGGGSATINKDKLKLVMGVAQ